MSFYLSMPWVFGNSLHRFCNQIQESASVPTSNAHPRTAEESSGNTARPSKKGRGENCTRLLSGYLLEFLNPLTRAAG